MNKHDLRFIKTEENLQNALLSLLGTKSIDAVSVTELCHEAKCSRNAFYQHHETKYDLYSKVLNETVETIQESCRPIIDSLHEVDDTVIEKYIHRLLSVIHSRRREITVFLRSSHTFRDILCSSMYEQMIGQDLKITGKDSLDPETGLMTRYAVSGIAGFIEHWLLHTSLTLSEAQIFLDQCTRDILLRTAARLIRETAGE